MRDILKEKEDGERRAETALPKRRVVKRRRGAFSSAKIQLKAEKMYKKLHEQVKQKPKPDPKDPEMLTAEEFKNHSAAQVASII